MILKIHMNNGITLSIGLTIRLLIPFMVKSLVKIVALG